jgi:hypothetical protein
MITVHVFATLALKSFIEQIDSLQTIDTSWHFETGNHETKKKNNFG